MVSCIVVVLLSNRRLWTNVNKAASPKPATCLTGFIPLRTPTLTQTPCPLCFKTIHSWGGFRTQIKAPANLCCAGFQQTQLWLFHLALVSAVCPRLGWSTPSSVQPPFQPPRLPVSLQSACSPLAPCLQRERVRRGGRGEEGEECRLEYISRWKHQCFTVGTLLIALLYDYSSFTPSSTSLLSLLHQSCLQLLAFTVSTLHRLALSVALSRRKNDLVTQLEPHAATVDTRSDCIHSLHMHLASNPKDNKWREMGNEINKFEKCWHNGCNQIK